MISTTTKEDDIWFFFKMNFEQYRKLRPRWKSAVNRML